MLDSNWTSVVQFSGRSLEELLGPKRQELFKVIPMTIIYVLVFVTGVVGNVATCVVIARHRYMHTVTNFYLVNLAVSDLLLVRIVLFIFILFLFTNNIKHYIELS